MAASYPSATKSFSTKVDGPGHVIAASHINEIQDEVVAVENDLRSGLSVARGGTGLASGTSGGILGFTGGTTLASSVALAAGYTVIGGGAGATPTAVATGAPVVVALTDGATPALDASLGTVFTLAAAGDRTIGIPTNPTNGQKIIIRHLASSGARTLALNSGTGGFRFGTDVTSLTQTASGKTDYIGCVYSSIDSKWDVVAVSKGF